MSKCHVWGPQGLGSRLGRQGMELQDVGWLEPPARNRVETAGSVWAGFSGKCFFIIRGTFSNRGKGTGEGISTVWYMADAWKPQEDVGRVELLLKNTSSLRCGLAPAVQEGEEDVGGQALALNPIRRCWLGKP